MSISITNPFIKELCQYIEDKSEGRFSFGSGDTNNLKMGELVRGIDGVFVVQAGSPTPNIHDPIVSYQLDFWAVNSNAGTAYDDLTYIYQMFHQNISITTPSYEAYFSYALGQIEDMDRNSESRKMFRLPILFICRDTLIS